MKSQLKIHQNYIRVDYYHSSGRLRLTTGIRIDDPSQFQNGKIKSSISDYKNKQFVIDNKGKLYFEVLIK